MNISESIADAKLLGAFRPFHDLESWSAWVTFLRGLEGLPLSEEEVEVFCQFTGRSEYAPPEGGWRESIAISGRQSGKTLIASALAVHAAAFRERCADGMLYSLCIGQDFRAATRTSFAYMSALIDASPILRRLVSSRTQDTLRLESGVSIASYPCRPQSIRGLRACAVVLDELAFFRSGEGFAVDTEMVRAARPTLATTRGRLIVLSSPYGQTGELYRLHRQHFGRDDSPTLVWQAPAMAMNPTLPSDYLKRMEEDDPEAFRSEVLGEFRAGLSTLLDPESLEACVASDRLELPPARDVHYVAFVDPSGGRRDSFTVGVGHRDADRCVVDVVRAWRPPFSPAGVVEEIAGLLREYHVHTVVGDRYAGAWPAEAFAARGIRYTVADAVKSDLYLSFLSYTNSGRIELPDDPELLRELRGLERRRGTGGKDRVDHVSGAHDDRANAAAGVAWLCLRKPPFVYEWAKF